MQDPANRKTLPVSLLAEGRPCLVVGGGKVALRKTLTLLEAGAAVKVVSPEALAAIGTLAAEGRIGHESRAFRDADVEGMFVVFAATGDKTVNRAVAAACRRLRIPCCAVDAGWRDADFVTPATFRKDHITVSIATGGRSCRQSRMIRDNLVRHLSLVEDADLMVLGLSHEELPITRREPFHLLEERLTQVGGMLMQVWGIHEFVLLNTCNRIELIAIVSPGDAVDDLLRRVMGFDALGEGEYYHRRGFEAFEHVGLLSAGLFSQTPGENHIVSQLKMALDDALARGWAGGMMQEWVSSALHVSKHIRALSAPLLQSGEVEDLCMDYLESGFGSLAGRRVLVLGSGTVGSGLLGRVAALGAECAWCYHARRPEVPDALAGRVALFPMDDLAAALATAEIVIAAVAAPEPVLTDRHAPCLDPGREVTIVDLGLPRNVAPSLAGRVPGVRVRDLDDLKHWYRRTLADMDRIHHLGRQAADEHKDMYEKIIRQFQGRNPE